LKIDMKLKLKIFLKLQNKSKQNHNGCDRDVSCLSQNKQDSITT